MDEHGGRIGIEGAACGTAAVGPLARLFRNSPFLCVSLGLHLLILLLLALLTTQVGVARRELARLQVIDDPRGPLTEYVVPEGPPGAAVGGRGAIGGLWADPSQPYRDLVNVTPKVTTREVDVIGIYEAVRNATPSDITARGKPKFRIEAGPEGGDPNAAMDVFTAITIDHMLSGKTLVALLVDRSASVLYRDVKIIRERLDRYFSEVDRNLPTDIRKVGQWVVVSFADAPRVECDETCDLKVLGAALDQIQASRSGVENVGLAVNEVLRRYGNKGYKHILVAAITDEAGDDVADPDFLESAIKRLQGTGAKFYVFGYESTFCTRNKWVQILAANLKGDDRAAYQAYADAEGIRLEDIAIGAWANGGPECPRPELWWTESWHNWQHWGGDLHNIPSGLGMYALNRMTAASGGCYFLLAQDSHYDMDKMAGSYRPDACSVRDYDARMKGVPLRSALATVWQGLGRYHLDYDLRSAEQVQQMLARSVEGRQYCIQHVAELQRIVEESKPVGTNWERWLAHADVTIAELMRYRFMLGQYCKVLDRERIARGGSIPKGKRLVMARGKAPDDFVGGDADRQEHDAARQYIRLAMDRHAGTPWQVIAERMNGSLYPWKCYLDDVPPVPTRQAKHVIAEPVKP